jgi:hypothetical protein
MRLAIKMRPAPALAWRQKLPPWWLGRRRRPQHGSKISHRLFPAWRIAIAHRDHMPRRDAREFWQILHILRLQFLLHHIGRIRYAQPVRATAHRKHGAQIACG